MRRGLGDTRRENRDSVGFRAGLALPVDRARKPLKVRAGVDADYASYIRPSLPVPR